MNNNMVRTRLMLCAAALSVVFQFAATAGQYRLDAMIVDKAGQNISSLSKNIEVMAGYAASAGQ